MPDQIYKKSWAGDYEGSEGAIATARVQFEAKFADGYLPAMMAFASTLFSAMGHNYSKFLTTPWWRLLSRITYGYRAYRYRREAKQLAMDFKRMIGGFNRMHPDQLDIYQSVMLACGEKAQAFEACTSGLERLNLSPDTRVLLLMGQWRAIIALDEEHLFGCMDEIRRSATELAPKTKPTTQVRFHRWHAEILIDQGFNSAARRVLEQAEQIAREHGMEDQIVKLQPLFAKVDR